MDFFLDFRKTFDIVLPSILQDMLSNHGMSGFMVRWLKNWLKDKSQNLAVKGLHLAGGGHQWCSLGLHSMASFIQFVSQRCGCRN